MCADGRLLNYFRSRRSPQNIESPTQRWTRRVGRWGDGAAPRIKQPPLHGLFSFSRLFLGRRKIVKITVFVFMAGMQCKLHGNLPVMASLLFHSEQHYRYAPKNLELINHFRPGRFSFELEPLFLSFNC